MDFSTDLKTMFQDDFGTPAVLTSKESSTTYNITGLFDIDHAEVGDEGFMLIGSKSSFSFPISLIAYTPKDGDSISIKDINYKIKEPEKSGEDVYVLILKKA